MTSMSSHPPRKRDVPIDITDMEGPGLGLLEYFRSFLRGYVGQNPMSNNLIDKKRKRFIDVLDVKAEGRWVMARIDIGDYGQAGTVRSSVTGNIEHRHNDKSAPTSVVRVLAAAPPGAHALLILFEKVGPKNVQTVIREAFRAAVQAKYRDNIWEVESVTETNAWLAAARVEKLTARYKSWTSDLADLGGQADSDIGDVVVVVKPEASWARTIWQGLRSKDVTAGELIGIRSDRGEPDETTITAKSGDRTKTFVLDRERTPQISQLISEDVTPSNKDFRKEAFDILRDHCERVTSQPWATKLERGAWTSARLGATLGG